MSDAAGDRSASLRGRGTPLKPDNRYESLARVDDWEHFEDQPEELAATRLRTEFIPDVSQSIITENNSPDVPFRYSINPYRGCEHGCAYCYARPGHEYLGFNAGVDFESKVLVKQNAAALLRADLRRKQWTGEVIALSGVTDCYQPAEARFRLTRSLIEVLSEARQCFGIVTKNSLVVRDLDLLAPLAEQSLAQVSISVTTLDAQLARRLEPRTSSPTARLRAIRELASAGVPVRVMVAPMIPGLNDHEVAAILQAAREAGAVGAGYTLLRLPLAVEPIFLDWLQRCVPDKQARVEARIRDTRGGQLSDSTFGRRMRGVGEYADQIAASFEVFSRRYGLDRPLPDLDTSQFRTPAESQAQRRLF